MIDSVVVANSILELCFKHEVPITFGQLERATLEVEEAVLAGSGGQRHAFADHEHPTIVAKNATVRREQQVRHWIPRAGNSRSSVVADPGSALDHAIRSAYRRHRLVLQ